MPYNESFPGVFDPTELRRLQDAFDLSWQALAFAFDDAASVEAKTAREALASCLLMRAKDDFAGDAATLSHQALASMPPYSARWTH